MLLICESRVWRGGSEFRSTHIADLLSLLYNPISWDHSDDDLAWARRQGGGAGGSGIGGRWDPEGSKDPRGTLWWQEGRKVVTGIHQS